MGVVVRIEDEPFNDGLKRFMGGREEELRPSA
jgi:hypothetical protein